MIIERNLFFIEIFMKYFMEILGGILVLYTNFFFYIAYMLDIEICSRIKLYAYKASRCNILIWYSPGNIEYTRILRRNDISHGVKSSR